jgi:hypothetical protein
VKNRCIRVGRDTLAQVSIMENKEFSVRGTGE